jgi:hypothetical protein
VGILVWDRWDARNQIEAMHRPFVTYVSISRSGEDVILGVDGSHAATEIYCHPGQDAQIKNYGSGPAIKVRYALTPTNLASTTARPEGTLVALREGIEFPVPIPRGILQGNKWETVITYESLSGRKYQTKMISDNLVLTNISVVHLSPIDKWKTFFYKRSS